MLKWHSSLLSKDMKEHFLWHNHENEVTVAELRGSSLGAEHLRMSARLDQSGQRVTRRAGWLCEVWRQIRRQTMLLFYFYYPPFCDSSVQTLPLPVKTKQHNKIFILGFLLLLQAALSYTAAWFTELIHIYKYIYIFLVQPLLRCRTYLTAAWRHPKSTAVFLLCQCCQLL